MADSFNFVAEAAYGKTGAYVARITGRAPRVTFAREFIGRKNGKRGQYSEACITEPGLYELQDVSSKGNKDRTYRLVLDGGTALGGLRFATIDQSEAQKLATQLDKSIPLHQLVHFSPNGKTLSSGKPDFDIKWEPEPVNTSLDAVDAAELGVPAAALSVYLTVHHALSTLTPDDRAAVLRRLQEAS